MINFIECPTKKHIELSEKYNLKTINSIIYQGISKIVLINNVEVALIVLSKCCFNENIWEIDCFEVFIKKKRYGEKIIEHLIKTKKALVIVPLEESKGFWIKLGFRPYMDEIYANFISE